MCSKRGRSCGENIVGIGGSDYLDDWCREDKQFLEVFELASMLEVPGDIYIPAMARKEAWAKIESLMEQLEARYCGRQ
jgi:predicted metal-dependent TIM-barrel fold hydrolase